jgi:hypothetical protein
MARDPQVLAELERRGPANVRALLVGLGGGVGRNIPVALQLAAGVSDPPCGEVEDRWREKELEKEREAERVARDTLKWAKVGDKWSRIGRLAAVAAALAGIATIGVTLYIARQANEPKLALAGPRIDLRAEPLSSFMKPAGMSIHSESSGGPGSSSKTCAAGSSESRSATTHPAEPPPMT